MSKYNIHENLNINGINTFPSGADLNIQGNLFAANIDTNILYGIVQGNFSAPALIPIGNTGPRPNIAVAYFEGNATPGQSLAVTGNIFAASVLVADTPGSNLSLVAGNPTTVGARQYQLQVASNSSLQFLTSGVNPFQYKATISYSI